MAPNHRTLYAMVIILSLVNKSSAIYCYDCTSINNSACIDPKAYDDETRARFIPVVDCSAALPDQGLQLFCRKMTQIIYLPEELPETRVTRSCGWVLQEKPCYHHRDPDHDEIVCQCFSNFCNSADDVDPASITFLFLVLTAFLYFLR